MINKFQIQEIKTKINLKLIYVITIMEIAKIKEVIFLFLTNQKTFY